MAIGPIDLRQVRVNELDDGDHTLKLSVDSVINKSSSIIIPDEYGWRGDEQKRCQS